MVSVWYIGRRCLLVVFGQSPRFIGSATPSPIKTPWTIRPLTLAVFRSQLLCEGHVGEKASDIVRLHVFDIPLLGVRQERAQGFPVLLPRLRPESRAAIF